MTPKITDEQRRALQENKGHPVHVQDDQTHEAYLLLGADAMPALWEEYVRREVAEGLAAIDRGEVEDWEVESVKAEGRNVLRSRNLSPS
jgi:hypothetical protein